METNDSQRIPAAKHKVWAALNNPDMLKHASPAASRSK